MRRSFTSLIVGVTLGLIAVAMMYFYIQSRTNGAVVQQAPSVELSDAVVAAKDLPFGSAITRESLKIVLWPKASIPQGSFANIDDIFQGATTASGARIALVLIGHDEPLTRTKISGFGVKPTLSRQVENGKRAISIRIDDVVGVAGFVLPGDRVDILLTRRTGSGQETLITEVLLQNIEVVGIDQSADQAADKPVVARTATVEVTLEEAQKLVLAQQAGSLSLSLRSVETADQVVTRPITVSDLTARRPAPAAPPGPRAPSVRVRYGEASPIEKPVRP